MNKERDKERHDEELAKAGWEPDGTFSEHLAIGHAGDLYVIVPAWVGELLGVAYSNFTTYRRTFPTGCERSQHPKKQQSYFGSTAVRPRKGGVTPTKIWIASKRGVSGA